MKRRLIMFVLLTVFLIPFCTQAQNADTVVAKYVTFIGGKSAWKKVKTLVTSGQYDYGGIQFPFTAYAKSPNRYKFIVPFNGKYYAQAFDGVAGWKIDAFKNETIPTILEGKDARAMANEADVELENVWVDYKEKGHKAALIGKDTLNGVLCDKLQLTRKTGETEIYLFDSGSGQLVAKTASSKNAEMAGADLVTVFSDYRRVENITIPFKSVSTSNGQMILTITIQKAEVNVKVDNKEFETAVIKK